MKDVADCIRFFEDAVKVGSGIALDHGATNVSIRVGIYDELMPPSVASGIGRLTQGMFI